jgi:hypothetical protein
MCNNVLNRAVRKFSLVKPSAILNKVTDLVIDQFNKSDKEMKDEMDLVLCSLSPIDSLNGSYLLNYAGVPPFLDYSKRS